MVSGADTCSLQKLTACDQVTNGFLFLSGSELHASFVGHEAFFLSAEERVDCPGQQVRFSANYVCQAIDGLVDKQE